MEKYPFGLWHPQNYEPLAIYEPVPYSLPPHSVARHPHDSHPDLLHLSPFPPAMFLFSSSFYSPLNGTKQASDIKPVKPRGLNVRSGSSSEKEVNNICARNGTWQAHPIVPLPPPPLPRICENGGGRDWRGWNRQKRRQEAAFTYFGANSWYLITSLPRWWDQCTCLFHFLIMSFSGGHSLTWGAKDIGRRGCHYQQKSLVCTCACASTIAAWKWSYFHDFTVFCLPHN